MPAAARTSIDNATSVDARSARDLLANGVRSSSESIASLAQLTTAT
jgi:hypothetical protein